MPKDKNAVLWKLTRENSHRTSYLFGTMHVKDQAAFLHIARAIKCLSQCQIVACEYNLSQGQGEGMEQMFVIPNGELILDRVGDRKYDKMKKQMMKYFQLPLDMFNHLLPMTTLSVLSSKILSSAFPVHLDQYIWNKGLEFGLTPDGLESIESQWQIMAEIDLDYQIRMLKSALSNVSKFRLNLKSMCKMYEAQNIHGLYKMGKKTLGQHKALLLYDRNMRMTNKITECSKENNAFYAVGAAHLSGKKGILHLLKKKGFILSPLS